MMKNLHIVALLLVQVLSVTALHAQSPAEPEFSDELAKQKDIYQSKGDAVPEGYVIGRSLLSYQFILSSDFNRALASLGPKDRWLDIGAGEGRAILDYCTSKYDAVLQGAERGGKKAKAIAISIEDRRTHQWYQVAAGLEEKQIQYKFGKRFREYSREELGQFQVITDVLGGFSYTADLSLFMERALGFLEVNGSLHTLLQDVRSEQGTNKPHYPGSPYLTEIVNPDGSGVNVCAWLRSISCVEVTCELKAAWTPPVEVYRIRKTCADVRVPRLAPVHFEAGTPPERRFQLKDVSAQF